MTCDPREGRLSPEHVLYDPTRHSGPPLRGSDDCHIGKGCIIQEGAVLGGLCTIGDHCVLYADCIIGHESSVGDLVFVANEAIVGARTEGGEGSFIGLGSIILPCVEVVPGRPIGAGSIVLRNIVEGSAVFGNPARARSSAGASSCGGVVKLDYSLKSPAVFDVNSNCLYSYRQLGAEVRRVAGMLESSVKVLVFCFCRND